MAILRESSGPVTRHSAATSISCGFGEVEDLSYFAEVFLLSRERLGNIEPGKEVNSLEGHQNAFLGHTRRRSRPPDLYSRAVCAWGKSVVCWVANLRAFFGKI